MISNSGHTILEVAIEALRLQLTSYSEYWVVNQLFTFILKVIIGDFLSQ